MSDFIIGIGRYLLIVGGAFALLFAYVFFCGFIHKYFPRIGLALLGVVGAGIIAWLLSFEATVIGLGGRAQLWLICIAYPVILIGWIFFVFKNKDIDKK